MIRFCKKFRGFHNSEFTMRAGGETISGQSGMLSSAIIVSSKIASLCPPKFYLLFALFLLLPFLLSADGNSREEAARQLAERVAGIPNLHGPIRLEITDGPNSVGVVDLAWKEMLRKELEKHHLAATADGNAQLLRIFVTRTPAQLVFTATARLGDKEEVRILAIPRAAISVSNPSPASLRIEKQLLYESPDRIIDDAAQSSDGSSGIDLLIEKNAELLALRLDAAGSIKQIIAFPASSARLGRDFRAELSARDGNPVAILPARVCEFAWTASSEVKCHAGKPTWRPATQISSPCAPAKWKLLTREDDWTAADQLRLLADGETQAETSAAFSGFPGPILSINTEQNSSSALLVTQNLRTGNYEVYKITLVCGN